MLKLLSAKKFLLVRSDFLSFVNFTLFQRNRSPKVLLVYIGHLFFDDGILVFFYVYIGWDR